MARSFNGSTQYGSATSGVSALPASLSTWFYLLASPSSFATVLALDDGSTGNNRFQIGVNSGPTAFAQTFHSGTSNLLSDSSGSLFLSTWYHLAATADGSSLIVYRNGTSTSASNNLSPILSNVELASVNNAGSRVNYVNAYVAESAAWNVVLTASEIKALASGILPHCIRPASLQGYWPLWGLQTPEPCMAPANPAFGMNLFNAPPQGTHAPVTPFTPKRQGQYAVPTLQLPPGAWGVKIFAPQPPASSFD
jgi:hypothetical protein